MGMDAAAPPVDAPLPTDVPTLQAMVRDLLAELARLRAENAELKTKLDAALKHRFGRRSERRTPPPMPAADKSADQTAGHRLAGQLARSGVTMASSTLGDWLFRASGVLTPLYDLMHRRLLLSRVTHGDDTGVKVRVPGSNRTKKAHLWTCIGDADYPYVLFDFTSDYTADGPTRFLAGYKGYFQADALAQYEGLYGDDKVKHETQA